MRNAYDSMLEAADKNSLAWFLKDLAEDFELNADEWENETVPDYLRAIAAWIDDSNEGTIPDMDCSTAAKLFYMGKIYE